MEEQKRKIRNEEREKIMNLIMIGKRKNEQKEIGNRKNRRIVWKCMKIGNRKREKIRKKRERKRRKISDKAKREVTEERRSGWHAPIKSFQLLLPVMSLVTLCHLVHNMASRRPGPDSRLTRESPKPTRKGIRPSRRLSRDQRSSYSALGEFQSSYVGLQGLQGCFQVSQGYFKVT